MKKQTCSKLALLLSGLLARLEQNDTYFIDMTVTYRSGTQSFGGSLLRQTDESGRTQYFYHWNGSTQMLQEKQIAEAVLADACLYDAVEIVYRERGTNLILEGSDKSVRTRQTTPNDEAKNMPGRLHGKKLPHVMQTGERSYYIKVGEADQLLYEIGILTKEGKLKNDRIRKYNQIDHFIELLDPILRQMPRDRQLCVLDCACGKSYLSFVLNYYMRDRLKLSCRFIGVDYASGVVDASRQMAQRLGYQNMEFVCADMNSYSPPCTPDLLVSLHACDTATDMAIGLGICCEVPVIVAVPCCHKEMLSNYHYEPFAPLLKYPIFKARLSDTLTDALRCLYLEANGYEVTALEYISPLETPKNLMIKACKKAGINREALAQYKKITESLSTSLSIETYAQKP